MKLETIKSSLFALNASEAAAVVGGNVPAGSFQTGITFYADGHTTPDSFEVD